MFPPKSDISPPPLPFLQRVRNWAQRYDLYIYGVAMTITQFSKEPLRVETPPFSYVFKEISVKTRLLGRPQPQMYPPVTLNQYTWVNRTRKHFIKLYASRPHENFQIDFTPKLSSNNM